MPTPQHKMGDLIPFDLNRYNTGLVRVQEKAFLDPTLTTDH